MQPSDENVQGVLANGLGDKQPTVRLNAASALAKIKIDNPNIRDALVQTLKDLAAQAPEELMRLHAQKLLGQLSAN